MVFSFFYFFLFFFNTSFFFCLFFLFLLYLPIFCFLFFCYQYFFILKKNFIFFFLKTHKKLFAFKNIIFKNYTFKRNIGLFFFDFLFFIFSFSFFLFILQFKHNFWFLFKTKDWFFFAHNVLNWDYNFNFFSGTMALLVFFITSMVIFFSIWYLQHENFLNFCRFFFFLIFFSWSMNLLVLSNNFIVFFFAWEYVGLFSFLLINFWFNRVEATKAALKAVLVNKFSDVCLYFGLLLFFYEYHCFDFYLFFSSDIIMEVSLNNFICFFLLIGAVGKSSQIGLHYWLPDAMEGPTPVSSLLHAATMVTAGVYLLIRFSFLFEQAPFILNIVFFFGFFTVILSVCLSLYNFDIKKILAYSTMCQIGFMFLTCGLSCYNLAFFHLIVHAFYKCCLFLCSGVFIELHAGEQDIRKMSSNILKTQPYILSLFFLSTLSLVGLPLSVGFFSKEHIFLILENSLIYSGFFCVIFIYILWICTFIYFFIMLRCLFFLTFFPKENENRFFKNYFQASFKDFQWQIPLYCLCFLQISLFFPLVRDLYLSPFFFNKMDNTFLFSSKTFKPLFTFFFWGDSFTEYKTIFFTFINLQSINQIFQKKIFYTSFLLNPIDNFLFLLFFFFSGLIHVCLHILFFFKTNIFFEKIYLFFIFWLQKIILDKQLLFVFLHKFFFKIIYLSFALFCYLFHFTYIYIYFIFSFFFHSIFSWFYFFFYPANYFIHFTLFALFSGLFIKYFIFFIYVFFSLIGFFSLNMLSIFYWLHIFFFIFFIIILDLLQIYFFCNTSLLQVYIFSIKNILIYYKNYYILFFSGVLDRLYKNSISDYNYYFLNYFYKIYSNFLVFKEGVLYYFFLCFGFIKYFYLNLFFFQKIGYFFSPYITDREYVLTSTHLCKELLTVLITPTTYFIYKFPYLFIENDFTTQFNEWKLSGHCSLFLSQFEGVYLSNHIKPWTSSKLDKLTNISFLREYPYDIFMLIKNTELNIYIAHMLATFMYFFFYLKRFFLVFFFGLFQLFCCMQDPFICEYKLNNFFFKFNNDLWIMYQSIKVREDITAYNILWLSFFQKLRINTICQEIIEFFLTIFSFLFFNFFKRLNEINSFFVYRAARFWYVLSVGPAPAQPISINNPRILSKYYLDSFFSFFFDKDKMTQRFCVLDHYMYSLRQQFIDYATFLHKSINASTIKLPDKIYFNIENDNFSNIYKSFYFGYGDSKPLYRQETFVHSDYDTVPFSPFLPGGSEWMMSVPPADTQNSAFPPVANDCFNTVRPVSNVVEASVLLKNNKTTFLTSIPFNNPKPFDTAVTNIHSHLQQLSARDEFLEAQKSTLRKLFDSTISYMWEFTYIVGFCKRPIPFFFDVSSPSELVAKYHKLYNTIENEIFFNVSEPFAKRTIRLKKWFGELNNQIVFAVWPGDYQLYIRTSKWQNEPLFPTQIFVCPYFDEFYIKYNVNDIKFFLFLYELVETNIYKYLFSFLTSLFLISFTIFDKSINAFFFSKYFYYRFCSDLFHFLTKNIFLEFFQKVINFFFFSCLNFFYLQYLLLLYLLLKIFFKLDVNFFFIFNKFILFCFLNFFNFFFSFCYFIYFFFHWIISSIFYFENFSILLLQLKNVLVFTNLLNLFHLSQYFFIPLFSFFLLVFIFFLIPKNYFIFWYKKDQLIYHFDLFLVPLFYKINNNKELKLKITQMFFRNFSWFLLNRYFFKWLFWKKLFISFLKNGWFLERLVHYYIVWPFFYVSYNIFLVEIDRGLFTFFGFYGLVRFFYFTSYFFFNLNSFFFIKFFLGFSFLSILFLIIIL